MHLSWQCTHGVSHGSMYQKILSNCDNLTVVDIWAKGSTKFPEVMALVCIIFVLRVITLMLVFNISLVVKTKLFVPFLIFQHICFRELAPDAEAKPTNIPAWPAQAFKIASYSSAIMALLC